MDFYQKGRYLSHRLYTKGGRKMKDEDEVRVAWILWQVLVDFTNLLWDRYEKDFIDRCLNEEEQKEIERHMVDDRDVPF